MKFSIITATKNAGDQIENTIKSVIIQKNVKYEHIIIDAVSSDNTIEIVEEYKNNYPVKLISDPDDGISDAFNKGIKLSSGDWIIFMGAGDMFIHSNVLSDMGKELKNRSSSLVVWGNIKFINANGEIGKRVSGKFSKFRFKRYMCMPHQATFQNKKVFEEYGMFSTDIKVAMDYDIFLRCLKKINMDDYIDYDVSYMLAGGNSQTGNNCIKEFMKAQNKNNVFRFKIIPKTLYIWAVLKKALKYSLK